MMSLTTQRPDQWSEARLHELNAHFQARSAEQILTWAAEQFGEGAVLTCSFGGSAGMVLLDMVARRGLPIELLFLDTELLFPETYQLAETAARHYGIVIKQLRPALSLDEQARRHGPELYASDPDRCCAIRKVAPLAEALRPYNAWISGIRRDQTAQRASTDFVQWNTKHSLLKISPLAYWNEHEVWAYINAHNVPYNPLLNQGYPSLGCTPCTRPAATAREGRWSGFAKTECGLHL